MKIFTWLNDSARWHDLGHVMFGSLLYMLFYPFCGGLISLSIVVGLALVKELFIDGHFRDLLLPSGRDGLYDISHYLIGCVIGRLILILYGFNL